MYTEIILHVESIKFFGKVCELRHGVNHIEPHVSISNNMHHTRNNSKVFIQSVHIPTYFGGGHYHQLLVIGSDNKMLLSAYNRRTVGNSGVLAYKVNALMVIMGATETCRNMDGLRANIRISTLVWCVLFEIFRQLNKLHRVNKNVKFCVFKLYSTLYKANFIIFFVGTFLTYALLFQPNIKLLCIFLTDSGII